jgi:hypothetical protein
MLFCSTRGKAIPSGRGDPAFIMEPFMSHQASSGYLAEKYTGKQLPLVVLHSAAGYYIGTHDCDGPVSRESCEYFRGKAAAERALAQGGWTQFVCP